MEVAPIWLFAILIVFLLLFYGDVRARANRVLTPEKAAAWQYSKWPRWKTVEPREDRIRVLWIIEDYVPWVNAGSEVCTHEINTFLMKKPYKWDVWVAAPGQPKVTYEGVRCFDLYDTQTLLEVLNSSQIIQTFCHRFRKQLNYITAKTGIPVVTWIHTEGHSKTNWHVNPDYAPRVWNVFNSKSMLEAAGDDVPNSAVFIPIVDFRAYKVEKHKPRYVTLSNLNSNKGGALLIQLAKACPEMEFLGVEGGYAKQIKDTSLPNLTYLPHTNRIKDVYEQTWVQIMPSAVETWGRTAVEAMSSGIPVVVSPTPGLKECCGAAAIYVDRDDLEGWVRTLRRLKADSEFYKSRSKAAFERARALDPRPVQESIEDWLESKVLPSASPAGRPLTAAEKNMLFR
jgi:glycosyltransferase involved in cell wall biosynthesis